MKNWGSRYCARNPTSCRLNTLGRPRNHSLPATASLPTADKGSPDSFPKQIFEVILKKLNDVANLSASHVSLCSSSLTFYFVKISVLNETFSEYFPRADIGYCKP